MPLLKSKSEDLEKQEDLTSVKGTISVSLNDSNMDEIVRRGYTEVISHELKVMVFYEPVFAEYEKERKAIDDAWAVEMGNRKKKVMPRKQLELLTRKFEKKYGK